MMCSQPRWRPARRRDRDKALALGGCKGEGVLLGELGTPGCPPGVPRGDPRGTKARGRTPFTLSTRGGGVGGSFGEDQGDDTTVEPDNNAFGSDISESEATVSDPASPPPASEPTSPALGLGSPAPRLPPHLPAHLTPQPACSWAASGCSGAWTAMPSPPHGPHGPPSRLHVIWVHRSALPLPVQWYSCLLWGVLGGMVGGALGGVLGGSLGLVVSRSTAGAAAATIGGAIGML